VSSHEFDSIIYRVSFCHRLPKSVSPDEGALLEPLSVGVYSVRRAGVNAGDSLLVCGAGPIGLVTVMAAKAFSASHVCITGTAALCQHFKHSHLTMIS
jgi:L-iditol 2-dehydrogenase